MGKVWREELKNFLKAEPTDTPQSAIAKEILRQLNQKGKLKIPDIAEASHSSWPTVIRFAQSFGFEGFKEFREELLKQDAIYYFEPIEKSFEQSYDDYNKSINYWINSVSKYKSQVIAVANLLKENERIFIFASPELSLIGNSFADRLKFIDFESYSVLNNQHLFLANTIRPKDLLLFLVSGYDNESLLHLWKTVNPTTNTFLVASASQFDKFENPNFSIKLEVGQSIMRMRMQQFLMQYILDQLFNLILSSDRSLYSSIISSEYRF